jgi:multicomponent Na+:H+ antiporter subunit E
MALKQENFHFTVSSVFEERLIKTMRVGLLFIVLMAGWLLMSGHYNGLLISLGVISVAFCVWLSHAINATDEEGLPTHIFARLPAYLFWLFGEIIKSNYATAKFILNGRSDPEIFNVTATQNTAAGIATYANSITLTPGTVTIDINEEFANGQFLVHALHADFGEDVRSNDMDRRVTALEVPISRHGKDGTS